MRPHAVRRAVDWRLLLSRLGVILTLGGGIILVSTPAAGGIVFGLGGVLLVASEID